MSSGREAVVREAFADQSRWCARLGSPFTARLTAALGRCLDRNTVAGRMALDWPGPPDALGDNLPLRLAGALHGLVRSGQLVELAGLYPPNPLPCEDQLGDAAMAAIAAADGEICRWLELPPQTNEVARSAILYPGLMTIASATGLPLALFEIGASAGLNLIPDRYAYRLGDRMLGRDGSPVLLSPRWTGSPITAIEPVIHSRRGCDKSPFDITDASHRRRLLAYIWPDQRERISRFKAASELAAELPPAIDTADAADWVDRVIGGPASKRLVRVLYHSVAYQYFPEQTKDRIASTMAAAGRRASHDAPLAWLAFEQFKDQGTRLTLRLWPDGKLRVLAQADAHGREIHWLEPD